MAAPKDSLAEVTTTGAFVRSASALLGRLGTAEFPAEGGGRYALYVSYACPWASRVLAGLALKGLEDAVRVIVCAPTWEATRPSSDDHRGWVFRKRSKPASADAVMLEVPLVDPIFGSESIRDVYEASLSSDEFSALKKYTVPLLVDTRSRRAVCNESSLLLRDFGGPLFNAAGALHPALDLFPSGAQAEIERLNDDMYEAINNGVYKCGFATSQQAYEVAAAELGRALDVFATRLEGRSFLVSDSLTEADIRLFVTLVRYDPVYVVHFKCVFRCVRERPSLLDFCRRVFQARGGSGGRSVGEASVRLDHIKQHYFGSHHKINPYGIVPVPHPREGRELAEAPGAR